MDGLKEAGFWVAVAGVSIVGLVLFKIAAASPAGDRVPVLRKVAAVV